MTNDEKWMQIAIQEAMIAELENEVPVGAILVKNDRLIAKAHNQPISKHDATAHAEIQLIRNAGQKLQNYRLNESTIYVTLEPCTMCFGAMIHARIKRLVFGASDFKTKESDSYEDLIRKKNLTHKIDIQKGVLDKECQDLLKKFFQLRR